MTAADLNTDKIKKIFEDFEGSPDGKTQIPEDLLQNVHKVIVGTKRLKIFFACFDFFKRAPLHNKTKQKSLIF